MADLDGLQIDSINPVERFKNYVREWWERVIELHDTTLPRDSSLYVEKMRLLERAKKIRGFIEKLPGMAGVLPDNVQLDGWPAALAIGSVAVSVGGVIGTIKYWDGKNYALKEKIRVYDECLARGYDPKYCSDIAAGLAVEDGFTTAAKWVPWIVFGLGIGFFWWSTKGR